MRIVIHPGAPGAPRERLLVLLTGSFSEPEDFVREGFLEAARAHGVASRVVLAQARAAWFADGTIVRRLREQVVEPARREGFTHVWLAGISIGALAALCYAARHEADLRGIVLISPYPATREVLREMEQAGGLGRWSPRLPPEGDLEREAWLWLAQPRAGGVPVHCWFASGDRFAPGQRRMAEVLPPEHVAELPGGHDWAAWRRLWEAFLARDGAVLR